jgi:hypothetical protein
MDQQCSGMLTAAICLRLLLSRYIRLHHDAYIDSSSNLKECTSQKKDLKIGKRNRTKSALGKTPKVLAHPTPSNLCPSRKRRIAEPRNLDLSQHHNHTHNNDLHPLPTDGLPTPRHPPLPPRPHHNTHPPLHRLTTNRQPFFLFTHTPRRHINRSRTTFLHTFECFSLSRLSPSPQQCRESSTYSQKFCGCWNYIERLEFCQGKE